MLSKSEMTRKSIIGDDGSLLIKPVNVLTPDYTSSVWYSHVEKTCDCGEKRFPSRVVCSYDNFSVTPVIVKKSIFAYIFQIGTFSATIQCSTIITSAITIEQIIDGINTVILTASYLQDQCLINSNSISDCSERFTYLYLGCTCVNECTKDCSKLSQSNCDKCAGKYGNKDNKNSGEDSRRDMSDKSSRESK